MIFFHKSKVTTFKKLRKSKKKNQSNLINFKLLSTPSGGFLKNPELLRQNQLQGQNQ